MAGDEDDRNANVGLGQLGLKIEAAQSRQPDVEHQAAGNVRQLALQQLRRRAEHLDLQSHRLKKIGQRPAHREIVVDNEDDRLLGRSAAGSADDLGARSRRVLLVQRQGELKRRAGPVIVGKPTVVPP